MNWIQLILLPVSEPVIPTLKKKHYVKLSMLLLVEHFPQKGFFLSLFSLWPFLLAILSALCPLVLLSTFGILYLHLEGYSCNMILYMFGISLQHMLNK